MPSKTADRSAGPVRAGATRETTGAATSDDAGEQRATEVDLGKIEYLRILDEHGHADEALDPGLDDDEMRRVYRAMVLTRKLDVRMLAMQRQGEMGTFAPGFGQEATQIGQVYPLADRDWYSPSYRSFGAQLWRGWSIEGLMLLWDGFFEGFAIPDGVNDLPFSIVIGSHPPLAVGVGMAIRARGDDGAVLVNFGDGAMSQGSVLESLNFAAVYKSPVVFVCENNGYAISMPAEKQSATKHMATRGPGFGMPAIIVDGNDILAMITATRRAVERARKGDGPTLIEAMTYRMQVHTTADDPKVYRSDDEVDQWKPKDPIARFERYLVTKGLLDDDAIERFAAECEQQVLDGRERFRSLTAAKPEEIFDFVFENLTPELEAQKQEYLRKLGRGGSG